MNWSQVIVISQPKNISDVMEDEDVFHFYLYLRWHTLLGLDHLLFFIPCLQAPWCNSGIWRGYNSKYMQ